AIPRKRCDHVLNEREVTNVLWGQAEREAAEAVLLGHFLPPLVETEWWVGDHAIVENQLPFVHKPRVPNGVALFDPGIEDSMQQEVQLANRPGAKVLFLTMQG